MDDRPADNLQPLRQSLLPYGRQAIDDDDIAAVVKVLKSDWLTTGPGVGAFESAVASFVGAAEGVAVSSGTAALHAAMFALGIGPGDEVIVPALTFAATANAVVYQGGRPVFADVEPDTLLIDAQQVRARITPKTRAVVAVDYAGQPCDYDALRRICAEAGIALVADGCHALGASYNGRPIGSVADLTAFSLHPVKHITTGEGGVITTNDSALAAKMRVFRNHGITTDHRQREERGSWFYEMDVLGYNYRLTDFQCALGMSQLPKLPEWVQRRRQIAGMYDRAFAGSACIAPLTQRDGRANSYHLYVIQLKCADAVRARAQVFAVLRARNVGVNVHYVPVHLHPYYRKTFGTAPGLCPVAEHAYDGMLSLPMFPGMNDEDVRYVVEEVRREVDTACTALDRD